jgi:hypothetical protein
MLSTVTGLWKSGSTQKICQQQMGYLEEIRAFNDTGKFGIAMLGAILSYYGLCPRKKADSKVRCQRKDLGIIQRTIIPGKNTKTKQPFSS